ncbi:MAG: CHAT domain-containing protein, partial [Planctomycetaceae bacterium]|nr:CHAT domain-containing protein [Planctomycetaceae bacterium]
SVLGGLHGALGNYGKARPLLRAVVDHFRQLEKSPTSLARALNNLGAVERGVGEFALATESFAEALQLREKHLASDDPELATSYNNLASACLVQGQFKRAIQLYQQVLERCRERGPRANGLQSVTLLNLSMAYKSQGQFEHAADLCQESLRLLEETAGRETMASVGHYNALATMARGQGRYAESYRWAEKSLAVCATHQQVDHLAAASAHTQIGIVACLGRAYATAESHWQQALRIQRTNQQSASVAFTLNMLGLLAYQQERFADAKQFFESARQLHENVEVSPQDRYNTLCNLAAVYRKEGQTEQALTALRQAIAIPEAFRSETFGEAEQGRAKFLAQFASAFDMQVQWLLEDKNYDAAFVAAEQSRNRTFLDQLNLAGVDLRQTLPDDTAKRLLPREQELRLQLQRLRIQGKLLPEHSNQSAEWQSFTRELNQTQSEYAQVWNEIRDSSQVYSKLLTQERTVWTLDKIRREVIAPDTLVLFYHLGAQQSVVLVLGDQTKSVVAVPLVVTSQQATLLPELPRLRSAANTLAQRGFGGTVETDNGEKIEADKEQTEVTSGPLTRRKGTDLVAWYRQVLRQKPFDPTRGIGGTVETTKGTAVPTTSFIAVADILFPEQLRRVIRERRPEKLVIIPDGALHNLPFEALLVRGGDSPRFVLDEFPPIAYAPSANILVNLVRRSASPPESRRSLLTLGNPQYRMPADIAKTDAEPSPEISTAVGTAVAATDGSGELTRDMMYGLRGSLPLLPGTARECARLVECFERHGMTVKTLLDANATEQQFVESVRGRGLVHLAAHGLVDERYGNLFGAIALTPPIETTVGEHNDGFLSYNEILQLPLADCELAVLSACQTNVGPDRPLEAGSTLAQAFLAAGARRIIASHWSVSDESTAELVAGFFDRTADGLAKSNRLDVASALHEAKLKIRNDPRWQAPYYWAPFVLLGPSN